MPPIVVYDANVLYGNTMRDLLIRLARTGVVQGKWTNLILDEMLRARAVNHPEVPSAKLRRLRQLMIVGVKNCLVEDFEPLIDGLELPDPDDRHVLAAAIKCRAQLIVTSNLSDFPAKQLAAWNLEAKSPDDFLLDQIDRHDWVVRACIQQIANSRINPPETVDVVLDYLERAGLVESAAALRSSG
ncbi:PIN domain-containing protein [Nocardia sp. NPDC050712]|uniref:PIN domain-containing protein n=1 Tax=Nocardia sp. NPDC050712 TaxID=3155518 RepID=UPI003410EDD6